MSKVGLVLSGGGARGAYQIGVLLGISEITASLGLENPIQIYTGVSAGALNCSFLASQEANFQAACQQLSQIWRGIHSDQVFRSDVASLGKIGFRWLEDLSFGALTGTQPGKALLDTKPLRQLIQDNFRPEAVHRNLNQGRLEALAVSAVDYRLSETVTFITALSGVKTWSKVKRHSELAQIEVDHIMASSAIPILFPPIAVGTRFFGDGCVRNSSPTSAAIHLGSEKLLVVGVRGLDHTEPSVDEIGTPRAPSVARVINLILNSVMLDGVEYDVERLLRINRFVEKIHDKCGGVEEFRKLELCWFTPSVDIGELAHKMAHRLPRILRYLIKGLGSLEDAKEIVSYLLFDPEFCSELIDLGYQDAKAQESSLRAFFGESSPVSK